MHDQKVVRRRRAALGLLVACSLALLSAYFGESATGSLHNVQRGFLEVAAPLQEGASRTLKPFRDLFGWVGSTLGAQSARNRLQDEVRQWRNAAIANQAAQRENAHLRRLLGLDRSVGLDQMAPVTARVTTRNPSVWYATVTIDAGSGHGVRAGQPVVSDQGLVGTVSTVTGTDAVVTLITDHTSGVSATVNQTGATGIVQPAAGDPSDLRLEFIRHGEKIRPGQDVVTAGTSSSRLPSKFPPDIPIAKVTRVDTEELGLYQRVHVQPFANLRRLTFVQVLTDPHGGSHR